MSRRNGGEVWVGVVFLDGQEADEVLDLVEREGPEAAVVELAGFDYGQETIDAALANGRVYDEVPEGLLDRVSHEAGYALVTNPSFGHVALYRTHPDPAGQTPGKRSGLSRPSQGVTGAGEFGRSTGPVEPRRGWGL